MIIKQKEIAITELCPDSLAYFSEDSLLFDIETTGFSSKTAYLYMIGCITNRNGILSITQYLAQKKEEEEFVLDAFFSLCKDYKNCITFNGDGFDIPFLCEKAKKYHQVDLLSILTSLDLYKQIKPLQSILKLKNLKQKSLEQFMGISREDQFHGGELISHFFSYEKTQDPSEERLLLLHNYEDLLGLICLLPMLSYLQPFEDAYNFQEAVRTTSKDYYGKEIENLLISARLNRAVPKPVSFSTGPYYLILNEKHFKLSVRVVDDKIYVPYTDYQNYYYLEKEDMAILKQLANYVDKCDRKPATPATAYGKFLLTEEAMTSKEIFQPYMKQVISALTKGN